MRIFLSYPSDVRTQVEEVAIRLRAAGHRVFFAPEDLPTGQSFDDRIWKAIRESDAFLCFLTPDFVTAGRYTLTELEIAKKRWPSPAGHVLPIRLREVQVEAIPAYLRAVTILEPKGNLAAEVIASVAGLKTRHKIRYVLAILIVIAVALGVVLWSRQPHLDVGKPEVQLEVPGYAGNPNQYSITARAAYRGSASDLKQARIEFLGSAEGQRSDWVGGLFPLPIASGVAVDLKFAVSIPAGQGNVTEFRACALVQTWACSAWTVLEPSAPKTPIPEALLRRISAVSGIDETFFVAMAGPSEVARLSANGEVLKSAHLTGNPTAIATAGSIAYVATTQPDAVVAFNTETLDLQWQLPIAFRARVATSMNEGPSAEVHSIAANLDRVWINTGQGAGSVLAYADAPNRKWVVPRYQGEIAFDLRDVVLAAAGSQIWGAETNSTPANAYIFYPDRYVMLDGHKYDEIGCAAGSGTSRAEQIELINCDGSVVTGEVRNGEFKIVQRGATLPNWPASNPETWTTYILLAGKRLTVAANVDHPNQTMSGAGWSSQVYGADSAGSMNLLATVPGVHVSSLAVTSTTLVAVLTRNNTSRQAIAIELKQ